MGEHKVSIKGLAFLSGCEEATKWMKLFEDTDEEKYTIERIGYPEFEEDGVFVDVTIQKEIKKCVDGYVYHRFELQSRTFKTVGKEFYDLDD